MRLINYKNTSNIFFIMILSIGILSEISCNKQGNASAGGESDTKNVKGDPSLVSSDKELSDLMELDKGTYTVEDFFKNPDKTAFRISPNGTYFSYMSPYESRLNIFVQKIGEEGATRITSETERDIPGYFWANENRLIYIKDEGGNENFKLFGVNKDGSDFTDLTPFDSVRIEIIDNLKDVDDEIIIGMNKNHKALFEPYRLNIESGDLVQLAENKDMFSPIAGWITDHEGKLRGAVKITDGTNANILYRPNEQEEFKTVLTTNFKEGVQPLFFDFDNGNVMYALSNLGRDKEAVVRFDMNTGKELELLYEHPEVDVSGLNFSRKRKVLTSISYVEDKRHYEFLDKEAEQIYNRIKNELDKYEAVITDVNKEEDKFLVRTYSDRSLGAYYYYDKKTDELIKLVDVSPWLNEDDLAEMKPVTYKSRDGLTIHGYLTLPKGIEPKNLPIIINPHGGPWARDRWTYNPEVQLLANRGYAVFQMNFRGSTGYGRKFWEASFQQWGQKMQDDISDGVHWLIKEGIADPDRIAIYGVSYGGYATLAGLTYSPELYACGVDYVGISNLFTFLKTIPPYWKPFLAMMHEMVGDPKEDSTMMAAYSPALNTDKINAPLFVVQGANDPRVNIDESDQIVKALREKGFEVPYMVKYNEGHGFSNEENRFEYYKAMTGFLAKHLKKGQVKG